MKNLFDYIKTQVDDAELYKKADEIISIEIKQGHIKAVDGKDVVGYSLRMNKDGKGGTAVSSSEDDTSIVDRAITSSKYRTGKPFKFLHEEAGNVQCYDSKLAEMTAKELIAIAKSINDRLNKFGDITSQISLERTISHVEMMNTVGLSDAYKKTHLKVAIATMSESGFVQNAYTSAFSSYFEISDKQLEDIVNKHMISNKTHQVETKRMPVVFSGKAMGALMTRLLAGVNGEFISKGVSPLEDKKNQVIASDILNISDEGNLPQGFATIKFDDEGTPTSKTTIIEKGVLKNFLNSVSSSEKLEGKVTGNAQKKTMFSKEIENQPLLDSTNFMVHPGKTSDADIIKDIDYGIYVDGVMGTHTGNIPAGEYSLNVSIGYLIEKGKLTGKVVDAMVSGNIYEDLFKIKAVGQKLELMNVVFYPMGYSPMVRFDEINVVGTK
ncbi:TldD/PmbA family protein [Acidaminobacter sp. JC074]|uniref:TldD/PmbA family protein n=1 Tax=Acidaminobacter sp. JC074 TaxID=2530199 RepID=UPI001F0D8109|nr:metallopeptidase TldD-related protein [Acidaminobacter sp. JC074]MCH4887996.1 TldD/PmbA family protein [Acidaminobacter sp. JC074]